MHIVFDLFIKVDCTFPSVFSYETFKHELLTLNVSRINDLRVAFV